VLRILIFFIDPCPNMRPFFLFFPAKLLLTPFRSQNMPPPMSSYQLALSPELPCSLLAPKPTAPIHVTFSPENDDLAILWESGYFEIWTLNMKLVPGSAKIMDPTKLLGGFAQTEKESRIRWRQILIRSNDASGKSFSVTVLGTGPGDQSDTITVSTVEEGGITGTIVFPLPYRNFRLVNGSVPDMCQSPDGELFTCKSYLFLLFCSHPVDLESKILVKKYAHQLLVSLNFASTRTRLSYPNQKK
jgi:elongator complex protein 1